MLRLLLLSCALAASASAQTFTDASSLLPERRDFALYGATIVDVDGDGRTDVVRPEGYLLQRTAGFEFTPFAAEIPLGAVFSDLNGDGRTDAFVLAGFEPALYDYQPAREALRRFSGPGANIDVSSRPDFLTQGSVLLDYDLDGSLDVFVGNDFGVDLLFARQPDGTYLDVSERLPQISRGDYGVMVSDFDRDGDPDIYIGLCAGTSENALYRNDDGTFVESAAALGLDDVRPSWGVVWFDFDNDGWLDVFVANMPSVGLSGENGLYRNEAGRFSDVASAAGVAGAPSESGWNATAADFDNDGWLDLFVANDPEPSRLYRNNADGTFSDITAAAGLPQISTIPLAAGDVDGDGWVDLYISSIEEALFLNDGGTNTWLRTRLRGVASNPDGIGARIEVEAGDLAMTREITAGGGMMSQSDGLHAHFGLGTNTRAKVTVRWPSGAVDVLDDVEANQTLTIVEGEGVDAPPAQFALATPADGAEIEGDVPAVLTWEPATDPEGAPVTYTVFVSASDGTDTLLETTEPSAELAAGTLSIGTYRWAVTASDGRSVRTSLDPLGFTVTSGVATEAPAPEGVARLEAWPNPARHAVSVRYELREADTVSLEAYDVLGRQVERRDIGAQGAGPHDERLDTSAWTPGVYVLRLAGEHHEARTTRLIVTD